MALPSYQWGAIDWMANKHACSTTTALATAIHALCGRIGLLTVLLCVSKLIASFQHKVGDAGSFSWHFESASCSSIPFMHLLWREGLVIMSQWRRLGRRFGYLLRLRLPCSGCTVTDHCLWIAFFGSKHSMEMHSKWNGSGETDLLLFFSPTLVSSRIVISFLYLQFCMQTA